MAVTVMQRIEMKYLLTGEQTDYLRERLRGFSAQSFFSLLLFPDLI